MDKYDAKDVLTDMALEHLVRFGEEKDKNKLNAEIEFYNEDIKEIIQICRNELKEEDLNEVLNEVRNVFSLHYLKIFNNK